MMLSQPEPQLCSPQPQPQPPHPLPPQQHKIRIRKIRLQPEPLPNPQTLPPLSHPHPQFVAAKSLMLVPPKLDYTPSYAK